MVRPGLLSALEPLDAPEPGGRRVIHQPYKQRDIYEINTRIYFVDIRTALGFFSSFQFFSSFSYRNFLLL